MMEAFESLLSFIGAHWEIIIAIPAVSLFVSAFQQKVNKWFGLQSDKVKTVVTAILSSLPVVIPAFLGFLSTNPQLLGGLTATIFTVTTFIYRFFVKPFSAQLSSFKEWKSVQNIEETSVPIVTDPVMPAVPTIKPSTDDLRPKEFQG